MPDTPERPRPDKPVHGPERPTVSPLLITVGILAAAVAIFIIFTIL